MVRKLIPNHCGFYPHNVKTYSTIKLPIGNKKSRFARLKSYKRATNFVTLRFSFMIYLLVPKQYLWSGQRQDVVAAVALLLTQ